MSFFKKIHPGLAVDMEAFHGMERPMVAFTEEMHRKQWHAETPLEQPWTPFHPALTLDINQRLYKFASELNPLLEQFWARIKDLSLSQDILDRWHQRRITTLLDIQHHEKHTDRVQDYFTALLFSRVYERAIQRRQSFISLHKKEWLQAREYMREHIQARHDHLRLQREAFQKIRLHPYEYEVKYPNEKKLLQVENQQRIELSDWERRLDAIFHNASKNLNSLFQHRYMNMIDQKQQFLKTKDYQKLLSQFVKAHDDFWRNFQRQLHFQIKVLMAEIEKQHEAVQEYKEVESSKYWEARSLVEDFTRKRIEEAIFKAENAKNTVDGTAQVPNQALAASSLARTEKVATDRFSLYPQDVRQAEKDPHNFDPNRELTTASIEIEKKNFENLQTKEIMGTPQLDQETLDHLDEHNKKINQVLAGHDYARQSQLDPIHDSNCSYQKENQPVSLTKVQELDPSAASEAIEPNTKKQSGS